MHQEATHLSLTAKLRAYKRKYYLNLLLKGSIISVAALISAYLLINSLEYTLRFNSPVRAFFLFSFLIFFCYIFYKWVIDPVIKLLFNGKQLSNEEAARQIGKYFPSISDKLLNTLQLQNLSNKDNALIQASIEQRTKDIVVVPFSDAIKYKENKKYLKYLAGPLAVVIIILLFIPQLITEGTTRIIHFTKEFVPQAPFTFVLQNKNLRAFKNEDFPIKLGFEGEYIPENVYLNSGGRRIKMAKNEAGNFEHVFQRMQNNASFSFDAAGYNSENYNIEVFKRPNLKNFNVSLVYPQYLNRKNERMENAGNLQVPEGTNVEWTFQALDTDSLKIKFISENKEYPLLPSDNQLFSYKKQIMEPDEYIIKLKNQYSDNKERIGYYIDVIPDRHPKINLEQFQDTTLYNFIILGGNISDDYGLTRLRLFYRHDQERDKKQKYKSINIPINANQASQSYYYQWTLDSLDLKQGEKVEYYLQVWDNDGINGRKSTKTSVYAYSIPSRKEIKESIVKASESTQNQIIKTTEKARELTEDIKEAENKLKGKKSLKWQDEKMLQDIIDKKKELSQELEKLKEQHQQATQQRERFGEENKKIKEKVEQLQQLMDELLDEETKRLYEELQKLLEEQKDVDNLQDLLEQIDKRENNLERELERTLELFKRMKFDHELEEVINELEEIAEEQEELSEKTGDKKEHPENLAEKQEELNKEFEDIKENIEELKDINQDLENPNPMEDTSEEEQEIQQQQQKSQESLEKNKRKQAEKSQKNASDAMKQLSKKMQQMQSGMEMTMMQENLDHLRDIVDNLVKLSFDQEDLMKEFREVNQSDPRFVKLSQQQLKLKDDAKIIEDSLLSLANRVFQIQSFVTREVEDMNMHMEESLEALKERNQSLAISKQQFTMTSVNNLALLLDDVLQQMQQQMADALGNPQKGQKKGKARTPGLGELQNQLNKKIAELKKSGKSGRELSEELAKLAAEQEQIRRAVQEMENQLEGGGQEGGGNKSNSITKKMEETETDLVNKRLTEETIERQKEILTRLLETEDAMREKEQEEQREAEHAKQHEQNVPKAFEDYIKAKEKEIELLKTIPPELNPYYKNEVNEYFKRLGK